MSCSARSSEHAAFGGVVPEIAARAHVEALDAIIAKAMREAGRGFDATRRRCRRRRPRADRRRHRRPDHGQGDRAGQAQAADRGQPPRSACAHRAADRRDAVSLLPVPRLRRPHPVRRGARRRRLCAHRHHAGRRHRRSLRQDREALGPRLSGRPAGREGSRARQRHALCAAAADARAQGCRLLALRA